MIKFLETLGIDIGNVIINHRLTDKDDKILYEAHLRVRGVHN